jgi:hypothetical protein
MPDLFEGRKYNLEDVKEKKGKIRGRVPKWGEVTEGCIGKKG